jgi:hypothetical protein
MDAENAFVQNVKEISSAFPGERLLVGISC